jgi:glucosamine-6-phosphate deaminase
MFCINGVLYNRQLQLKSGVRCDGSVDGMQIKIFPDKTSLSRAAAGQAAHAIQRAIDEHGRARIIAATGAAQFEFLDTLTKASEIDWTKVEGFHLDEYVGLPATHPASFRKFLMDRLVSKSGIGKFHWIEGDAADLSAMVRDLSKELASAPIDIAFVGIGENGHIAFNDPPADFTIEDPYIIVKLDEPCRQQQVGEGWFADLSQVPERAISMSARQILKAGEIIAIVPDERKAHAVKACLDGEISPMAPASILRRHANTTLYLDKDSSSLLSAASRARAEELQTPVSS